MTSMNQTFVLTEPGHFAYEKRSVPDLPDSNHVIVAVKSTGLCGSDVHYWKHGRIGDFIVTDPIILGHESSGIVERCGTNVRKLQPGDRVALEPGAPCRTCVHCRSGRYNLCDDMHFAATPPYNGTLATYYAIPADFCYRLPAQISMEEGALIEPLAVAVHCARLSGLSFGNSIVVLGAGPIGLLCCAVAKALGASSIVAIDIDDSRLQFAEKYAATCSYRMQELPPQENARQILSRANIEEGAHIVIDATGVETCIATGIHALQRGGTFVQAGLGQENICFPVAQLCSKEAAYRGSFRYGPGDYEMAVELLAQGRVSVKDLITHRYAFSEAEQAFINVSKRQGIKSIISGPEAI